ncbi:hypothetical protein [Algisphaera agarilytica]|uniref:Uncharacterized protein n=1 Tax=Algisphaera agarilytica TaxID=1385975 RepID=A0A7X0LJL6_9BACT|nr:hypothetical protein [Algisphaera agarilytica]MBB6429495.1 hypothetical protein [Algisphaera agarilytica]
MNPIQTPRSPLLQLKKTIHLKSSPIKIHELIRQAHALFRERETVLYVKSQGAIQAKTLMHGVWKKLSETNLKTENA